ncbi:MAG: hypothetical protein E7323_09030 [Clostridiales bacterium]|nr:hypothetical protein [Clostridiales bacterium]
MKKLLALMLALLLCTAAAAAVAETIQLEEMLLDNGLCFLAPADWTAMELDKDDYEEGYLLMLAEEDTGRTMVLTFDEGDPDLTTTALAELFADDEDYAGAQLVTNQHEAELVMYALADQTMISYCIVDEAGGMYSFSFLNAEGERISGDTALLTMVDACMADTYFDEDLAGGDETADETADPAEAVASGDIELKMVRIQDGPVFPIPADWSEVKLDNTDMEDGCLASYTDESTGRTMLIMANEIGALSTVELAEVLTGDKDYANVRLMTNDHGLDMVLTVTADLTTGGYCFMDEDGWLYNILFGLDGDTVMTDDAVLAQLVQDCMANTYFED